MTSNYTLEELNADSDWLTNGYLTTRSEAKSFLLYVIRKSGGHIKDEVRI